MSIIDLTGNKFGRWTVIKYVGMMKWVCKCDCGNMRVVKSSSFKNGNSKSCGCLRKDSVVGRFTIHGQSSLNGKKTLTYNTWVGMKQRCNYSKHVGYKNYGGRGIKVCKRWDKFENFYKDMGKRPKGTSIDRIDNDRGYTPKNCKWSTKKEQSLNKSNSKHT